ncbi:MAG: ATP-binding protein [Chloroflexi bacterium]|nr:ATP-binding protein [Chloroflexota bacterium]
MTSATFRFSTDILQRLGEELITGLDQGIVELVKNSYDADALTCTVELSGTEDLGGRVVITDDGDGMSASDIRDGWLVLGRSRKDPGSLTRRNRLPAGSKGLGRLGALRLGERALLVTRPIDEPGIEYSVPINWADFSGTDVVDNVALDIHRSTSDSKPGTQIVIERLRSRATAGEVRRLARELLLLSDPFRDPEGFTPELIASEFKDIEQLVRSAYFDDCEFRLVAQLNDNGRASAKVYDRSGTVKWSSRRGDFDRRYSGPAATFELWAFLLQRKSFEGRAATIAEVRRWLDQVGGVHLYHRGLRVRPYGDDGHDWLGMNLSRVRDPELRPSTNTSVGRVTVRDERELLLQKTDRTGFIENQAFRAIRKFAIDALEWMHKERLAERRERETQRKRASRREAAAADTNFRRAIEKLDPSARATVRQAALELESARATERDQLRDELSLYQTLASVGTAVSVFAHEIEGPATDLTASVRAVERRAQNALKHDYESRLARQMNAVKRSATQVARFATLPLNLLRRSKRRRTILNVNQVIEETVTLFEPYLVDAQVATSCEFTLEMPQIRGSVAAIEAIISNLITNSVKAFKRQLPQPSSRRIVVRTILLNDNVLISVLDNGPGIPPQLADSIWLPGVTSDENGTGMGLTIVRDTATDLGGRAKAIQSGELGGAEFLIELPRLGERS